MNKNIKPGWGSRGKKNERETLGGGEQVRELQDPGRAYAAVLQMVEGLARVGLVHCDLNEFNLMVRSHSSLSPFCRYADPVDCFSTLPLLLGKQAGGFNF